MTMVHQADTRAEQVDASVDGSDAGDLESFAAQQCPDVILVIDDAGTVRYANEAVERLLGLVPAQHIGVSVWDFVHPDDLVAAAGALNEAIRSEGYHLPTVFRIRHADGRWVDCEVNGSTADADDGVWLVLAIRSVGDRDEVMGRRRRIERLIRMASLECSAVRWTDAGELVERYLADLAGIVGAEIVELAWEESEDELAIGARWPSVRSGAVVSKEWEPFIPLWPLEETAAGVLSFSAEIGELAESPMRDRFKTLGSRAAVEVALSPRAPWAVLRLAFGQRWLQWDDTNVDLVVVLASALMATLRRCLAESHLHARARTDLLTGLMNRDELYLQLESLLAKRVDAGPDVAEGNPLGVLYCDLDYFKSVNDRYGHGAGDQLLVAVADSLRENTRDMDLIARVGGDEFVVVCPALESPEMLSRIMARLCHSVAGLAPPGVPLRLSVGSAMARPGLDVDDLLRLADEAMYRVKRDGRRHAVSS